MLTPPHPSKIDNSAIALLPMVHSLFVVAFLLPLPFFPAVQGEIDRDRGFLLALSRVIYPSELLFPNPVFCIPVVPPGGAHRHTRTSSHSHTNTHTHARTHAHHTCQRYGNYSCYHVSVRPCYRRLPGSTRAGAWWNVRPTPRVCV